MKQVYKLLLLALCLSLAVSALVACADVRGTYVRNVGETLSTTYAFDSSENTVKVTERVGTEVYEYEVDYKLSSDGNFITFYEKNGTELLTEQFEQGEDYIKIGVIKYFKA